MMNQQKTKKAGMLKYSLIVPLALILVLSSNAETLVNTATKVVTSGQAIKTEKPDQQVSQKPVKSSALFTTPGSSKNKSQNEKVYNFVDQMPQFPGGESELLKYIGTNLKYPKIAQDKGIQGKVILRFVVNNTGKVEKAEIVRRLDPLCDKEALRVVNSMPRFIPAKVKGKNVAVNYTLPITFKLE